MTCEDWRELTLDREELQPEIQRELGQHLSDCIGCRAFAEALAEIEANLTAHLRADFIPSLMCARIPRAATPEWGWRWVSEVPELLDTLGWSALAVLAMTGLFLWSGWWGWVGNHLLLAGVGTVVASLVWACHVSWDDRSGAHNCL